MAQLEQLMVRFSQLVAEQPWIKEIDINPLIASPEKLLVLDARIVLHDADTKAEDLPKLAIRPYPSQYVEPWEMRDGTAVTIRPMRPEDEPLMVEFHQSLSERSIQGRYFRKMEFNQRVRHERLRRICFIDYDRELALAVERKDAATGEHKILGVGRLRMVRELGEADFAIIVTDPYQHQGIGAKLMGKLIEIARKEKCETIAANMLTESAEMRKICEKMGFAIQPHPGDANYVRATMSLK
jgi:acetyltransferase